MSEWNISDLLVLILLMILVPVATGHYLRKGTFTDSFRHNVMILGLLWLAYSWLSETYVYYLLGISRADGGVHWTRALTMSANLARGEWPFGDSFPLSNDAYVAYLAYLNYFGGVTELSAVSINAFLGFMGGLTLARTFMRGFVPVKNVELWGYLVIFFPSAVFWTTSNMKEGLMYWSVCQILSIMPAMNQGKASTIGFSAIAGVAIGGILRPHVCAVWLLACAAVELIQRGKRGLVVILLIVSIPLTLKGLERVTGTKVDSPDMMVKSLSQRATGVADPTQGSYIDYGPEGATFFISGFTAVFFRPFPWDIKSTRVFVSSVETWSLTCLIIVGWLRARREQRRWLLSMPIVRVSILAILMFSVIFTYLPNEGLLVRQRVQVVPGLLVLALLPFITGTFLRYREWQRRARIARQEYSLRGDYSWR
ncbi:hypothetical protein [Desulfomonile tiedjei]|uniref:Glycosyltransferase RgtA/B/C/D-like domain-containing protein n=1 Tax=Desulfomonile tiedjei (strain ATCC 49306 / DSM 6799 / DCB-1) TaxID=706587 RepID=I4C7E9_DESTA|nr:hypothetical protein [Desulfomonile tiedjei]AFM25490.1 hypothetical protein Desti_2820 [Desulfomonile tiedjei DSM 6799]